MRIVSLHLHHFGAVTDERLDFSDGLSVVCGPNEAGKSTWHAAATLLLTGFPKSLRHKSVKPLYERYRPWSGSEYKISGVVELDDGRRLRIVRDFAARTSQIHDEGRGPLSSPITTDATCDLAELVGLDRSTLPLVASVRQTEILELARSANAGDGAALRDFLQRSLASRADSDSTAESAIDAIGRFRRTHIGANKQGSTKPMRRAVEAAQAAEAAYDTGVSQWEQYHQRERELAADCARADELGARLVAARTESLRVERARLGRRIDEIAAIDAELAKGDNDDVVPSDELFDQARQIWARRSVVEEQPRDLDSIVDTRDQLRSEIATLPDAVAAGPEVVPESVTTARIELEDAQRFLALVMSDKPAVRGEDFLDVDAAVIRSVAAELEGPAPLVDPDLRARRDDLAYRSEEDQRRATRLSWLAALFLIVAIGALVFDSVSTMGVGFVLLGASAMTMWRSVQTRQRLGEQHATVSELDRRLAVEADQADAWRVRRRELQSTIARWGCRPTPGALQQLASRVDDHFAARESLRRWEQRHTLAEQRCRLATSQLVEKLDEAGWPVDTPVKPAAAIAAVVRLETAVAERRRTCAAQDRRRDLVAQCALLDETIETGERVERRIDAYTRTLESFLITVGITAPRASIDDQLEALENWLRSARELRTRAQANEKLRARRDALCAHGELDRLRARIAELDQRLADRVDSAPSDRDAQAVPHPDGRDIAVLEDEYRTLQERIDRSRGALGELGHRLTELTTLAEDRAKARGDLDRIVRQEALLDAAEDHLSSARSRVHSALAPQLVQATADRLALVTAGRYKRLDINPDDLSVHVEVEAGTWHDSTRLSFGTVEQIYLLLRTAIAEVVSPATETCPLFFDDATVHADADRTEALVEVLAELGRERQVIMFSQEAVVRTTGQHRGATVIDLAA